MIFNPKAEEVAKLVQAKLNAGEFPGVARVLVEGVRLGGDGDAWWYVPVSYQEDPFNAYKYYGAFSRIEEELESVDHVNVLLVPRIIPPPPDAG